MALIITGLSVATYPYSSIWFSSIVSSENGIASIVLIVLANCIPQLVYGYWSGWGAPVNVYRHRYRNPPKVLACKSIEKKKIQRVKRKKGFACLCAWSPRHARRFEHGVD
jgi:hypothetical protein